MHVSFESNRRGVESLLGVFEGVEGLAGQSPFLVVEVDGVDHEPLVVTKQTSPPGDEGEEGEDHILDPAHNQIVP